MTGAMSFWVCEREYHLPAEVVREVVRVEPITPVPRSAPRARGLTSLRGRLVPVVDLAVALGHPPARVDDASRLLLVASGARLLGLLVDRVGRLSAEPDGEPLDLGAVLEGP